MVTQYRAHNITVDVLVIDWKHYNCVGGPFSFLLTDFHPLVFRGPSFSGRCDGLSCPLSMFVVRVCWGVSVCSVCGAQVFDDNFCSFITSPTKCSCCADRCRLELHAQSSDVLARPRGDGGCAHPVGRSASEWLDLSASGLRYGRCFVG